jgi:quinol monooxygenase YgiN
LRTDVWREHGTMIHVIATITVAAGKRDAFLAEFHRVVPDVLAEDGCLAYGPTIDTPSGIPVQTPLRADVVVVVEQWRDLPALRKHLEAPHMATYRERVQGLVLGAQLQVLQPA